MDDYGIVFFGLLVLWLFSGLIGYLIARGKGRGAAGFWWSFFLGIIGWIIAACLSPSAEVRRQEAIETAMVMREALK